MKVKLDTLKVFNSVKVGNKELMFFKSSDGYDITLDGLIIRILNTNTNEHSCTSLMNAPWWTELETVVNQEKKSEQKKGTSSTKRVSEKKDKST